MKNIKLQIISGIISIGFILSACSTEVSNIDSPAINLQEETQQYRTEISENDILEEQQQINQSKPQTTFSIDDIIPYSGQPYISVNNNIPYFSESDLTTESFEYYSDLDDLGRCGVAYANIGLDIMPTEERGEIGQVKPTGWHTVKYDNVSGKYLYNRCHLIGYQLSGENANEKNLITGTRYLNVDGMLPFENMVADYVKETENHVLYRVTPVFEDNNLLASGVLMEAQSVEDSGDGILFCVYAYNVQPDIIIDYATGESSINSSTQIDTLDTTETTFVSVPDTQVQELEDSTEKSTATQEETVEQPIITQEEPQETTYILNTNTHKFHYPSCSSVNQMSDKNKQEYAGNRNDIISMGYDPCKRCNP